MTLNLRKNGCLAGNIPCQKILPWLLSIIQISVQVLGWSLDTERCYLSLEAINSPHHHKEKYNGLKYFNGHSRSIGGFEKKWTPYRIDWCSHTRGVSRMSCNTSSTCAIWFTWSKNNYGIQKWFPQSTPSALFVNQIPVHKRHVRNFILWVTLK